LASVIGLRRRRLMSTTVWRLMTRFKANLFGLFSFGEAIRQLHPPLDQVMLGN
jgi:hypothetical protein